MADYYRGKDNRFTSILDETDSVIREKIKELLTNTTDLTYNEILMGFGYTTQPKSEVHQRLGKLLLEMKDEGVIDSSLTPSTTHHSMAVNRYCIGDTQ